MTEKHIQWLKKPDIHDCGLYTMAGHARTASEATASNFPSQHETAPHSNNFKQGSCDRLESKAFTSDGDDQAEADQGDSELVHGRELEGAESARSVEIAESC